MNESRNELINWVNNLLQLNIIKIEQLGTGAVYCQIIDSIYVDVPLSKVKFDANQEFQYIQNFKVLQTAFDRHHISNAIPVEKLVKLKFQDNLEFIQWLKKYWDSHFPNHAYDPVSRRSGSSQVIPPASLPPLNIKKSSSSDLTASNKRSSLDRNSDTPVGNRLGLSKGSGGMVSQSGMALDNVPSKGSQPTLKGVDPVSLKNYVDSAHRQELAELNDIIAGLKVTLESMEKERDFYFGKLREVEVLLQTQNEKIGKEELIQQIQEVLYSNDVRLIL